MSCGLIDPMDPCLFSILKAAFDSISAGKTRKLAIEVTIQLQIV